MRASLALLLCAAVLVSAGTRMPKRLLVDAEEQPVKAQPVWPTQYVAYLTVTLPYADITEQQTFWYDAAQNSQRTDYYGGLDSYILNGKLNTTWQLSPEGNSTQVCWQLNGPVSITSVLPDLTGFTYSGQGDCGANGQFRDLTCDIWTYSSTTGSKTSTYTMYVESDSQQPIRYWMMGYDSLWGSHFDSYEVIYGSVVVGAQDPAIFQQPQHESCPTQPGDESEVAMSWMARNPALDNLKLHPAATHEAREQVFKHFARKHGKKYVDDAEYRLRKFHFDRNLALINAHNRRGKSYKLALNPRADLSPEERRRGLNSQRPKKENNGATRTHTMVHTAATLPQAVDWRTKGAVSPVKDQGICGSCWSFGAHQTIEGAWFLKTGQLVRLSSQAFVDCSWPQGNAGCDGGQDVQAYAWALQNNNGNIPTEESYEYLMANGICHADRAATGATITGFVNVTSGDEQALMDALASAGPTSISIDAALDTFDFFGTGVYDDPACKNGIDDLDHTVLAVGYGTDPTGGDYWIVKNSWSTYWGDQGYIRIARQGNICGVATAPTYVLV